MTIEIEAKMRLSDRAALEEIIQSSGAKLICELLEINTYFDTSQGSLKASDRGLRVRIERDIDRNEETVIITHKGPRAHGKIKSRSETEVNVVPDDATSAVELLTTLGFHRVMSFEKRRTRWGLDGCHIELDHLPYIGDFVEIEGPDEQTVMATRAKLGLEEVPLLRASYIAMLCTYMQEHGIREDYVGMEAGENKD